MHQYSFENIRAEATDGYFIVSSLAAKKGRKIIATALLLHQAIQYFYS